MLDLNHGRTDLQLELSTTRSVIRRLNVHPRRTVTATYSTSDCDGYYNHLNSPSLNPSFHFLAFGGSPR
jgi:hypothetical protein